MITCEDKCKTVNPAREAFADTPMARTRSRLRSVHVRVAKALSLLRSAGRVTRLERFATSPRISHRGWRALFVVLHRERATRSGNQRQAAPGNGPVPRRHGLIRPPPPPYFIHGFRVHNGLALRLSTNPPHRHSLTAGQAARGDHGGGSRSCDPPLIHLRGWTGWTRLDTLTV
jgi:hypothetical protein